MVLWSQVGLISRKKHFEFVLGLEETLTVYHHQFEMRDSPVFKVYFVGDLPQEFITDRIQLQNGALRFCFLFAPFRASDFLAADCQIFQVSSTFSDHRHDHGHKLFARALREAEVEHTDDFEDDALRLLILFIRDIKTF